MSLKKVAYSKIFLICRRARQGDRSRHFRDKCENCTLVLAVQLEKSREIRLETLRMRKLCSSILYMYRSVLHFADAISPVTI